MTIIKFCDGRWCVNRNATGFEYFLRSWSFQNLFSLRMNVCGCRCPLTRHATTSQEGDFVKTVKKQRESCYGASIVELHCVLSVIATAITQKVHGVHICAFYCLLLAQSHQCLWYWLNPDMVVVICYQKRSIQLKYGGQVHILVYLQMSTSSRTVGAMSLIPYHQPILWRISGEERRKKGRAALPFPMPQNVHQTTTLNSKHLSKNKGLEAPSLAVSFPHWSLQLQILQSGGSLSFQTMGKTQCTSQRQQICPFPALQSTVAQFCLWPSLQE